MSRTVSKSHEKACPPWSFHDTRSWSRNVRRRSSGEPSWHPFPLTFYPSLQTVKNFFRIFLWLFLNRLKGKSDDQTVYAERHDVWDVYAKVGSGHKPWTACGRTWGTGTWGAVYHSLSFCTCLKFSIGKGFSKLDKWWFHNFVHKQALWIRCIKPDVLTQTEFWVSYSREYPSWP